MAIEKVRRNGPYAPLSATYYQDDDIAEAGEAAELLFLRGLAFCAGRPSDGFISDAQVVRFVGVGMVDAPVRAKQLAAVGLWERVDGGYVIRAWLKWNKSAEELGQFRASDRDRKKGQAGAEEPSGVRSDAGAEAETDPEPSPRGSSAESERNETQAEETGTEPDKDGEEFPRGLRSDSAAHYTSLHDTSLHTHTSAERTGATDLALFDAAEGEVLEGEIVDATDKTTKLATRRRDKPDLDIDPNFIAFWEAYPRKVDKGHARKAWIAKVNAGADPQAIAEGAGRYRDNPRRPTEARFIPHPATWINGERWADDDHVTRAPVARGIGGAWWDN